MSEGAPGLSGSQFREARRPLTQRADELISRYRKLVAATLEPLVRRYHPDMLAGTRDEYRKMLELSTKMSVVGHACTEVAGFAYDGRRQTIGALFGACCFLADSFIDDFGEAATREYLARLELLLTEGWFDVRTDRERLFYVVVTRLFAMRDVLQPTARQAILHLFLAQKEDVELRLEAEADRPGLARQRLQRLKECARNRSGHAILVLSAFLLPNLRMPYLTAIFAAGALIMYIDDHGDCYADLDHDRFTFMNQVKAPERMLRSLFLSHVQRLSRELPANAGRDLLIAFLTRYYLTRVQKHRHQRIDGASAWAVYE